MLTLLSLGLVFAVMVALVTLRAFMTSPEGYEDEHGFHLVKPWIRDPGQQEDAVPRAKVESSDVPPFVTAP